MSIFSLVWRHPLADLLAKGASIGAMFTLIALVTGSIWENLGYLVGLGCKAYIVLILFFIYLGHVALIKLFDDEEKGSKAAAILTIIGAINLPIIVFCRLVEYTSSTCNYGLDGPSVHIDMMIH